MKAVASTTVTVSWSTLFNMISANQYVSNYSSFDEQKQEMKTTETKEDAENTRTNENASHHQFQPMAHQYISISPSLASWCDLHCAICSQHSTNNIHKTVVRPVPQECPICSESFLKLQNLNCCGQKLCSTCIDQIIQTKHTQASEILAVYLSKEAHQCPKCELGPVEHFACGDLSGSTFNRCTSCQFSSGNINSWPAWNGVLPKSLQAYPPGQLDCPFCRNTSFFMDVCPGCTQCFLWHSKKCFYQKKNSLPLGKRP